MRAAGRVVVVALAFLGAGPAAASQRMSADDIATALGGIVLDGIYADGTYFTEAYHDDHSIRYWDANGAASGEWSIEKGLFCTFYENLEGACFAVERDGANCFTFFEMDPDNPALSLDRVDLARLEPRQSVDLLDAARDRPLAPASRPGLTETARTPKLRMVLILMCQKARVRNPSFIACAVGGRPPRG